MRKFIFWAFLFLLSGRAGAQPPTANFTSHTDGQTVTSPGITITWKGCSNATQSSYQTRINGVNVTTTQSSTFACPDYTIGKNYSASGTLANGPNHLYINVCDVSGCGEQIITVNYAGPAVSVTPDGASAPLIHQGSSGSYVFKVKNTGGQSATATFSNSCSGAISCSAAPSPSSIPLAAGDSTTVAVTYSGDNVGSGTATLTATYNEYPTTTDGGYVNVTVDPQIPSANFTSPFDGQIFTSSNITVTWKGCTNAAPSSGLTRLDSTNLTTTSSATTRCPEYFLGTNYSAPATLHNGQNTLFIQVCDVSGCGQNTITVTYNGPAVSVTPDGANALPIQRGQNGSYGFTVQNTGAQPATAMLTTSCTGKISCSGPPPTPIPLAVGASSTVLVPYSADSVGPGRAALIATYSEFPTVLDTGYVNVAVDPAKPAARFSSPLDGQVLTNPNITVAWKGCTDTTQTSHDTQLNGNPVTTTEVSGSGCNDYHLGKNYSGSATLRSGSNTLFAKVCDLVGGCGDTTITVTYSAPAVSVTPDGASAAVTQGAPGSFVFNVQNTGAQSATGVFSFSCPTQLSSCSVAPASATIAAGNSSTVTLSYTGANLGTGRVTLTATYSEFPGTTDNGYVEVTVTPPGTQGVSVTPDGGTASLLLGAASSFPFKVKNTGTQSATAAFSYSCTTQLNACSVTPASALIAAGDSTTATVSYTGANAGSGRATLRATYNEFPTVTDTGYVNVTVTVPGAAAISVTPDGTTVPSISQGAPSNYVFKVKNTGAQSATAAFSFACTTQLSSCSVAPTSALIAAGDSVTVTFSYTGAIVGTGQATLTATYNEYPAVTDNGFVNVPVTTAGQGTITVAGKNPGTTIDKASCLTISAGQNAAYECSDLRVVHPLPATVTMDRARGPALIYNSRHANPGALLAADVTYSGPAPTTLTATVVMAGQSNIVKSFAWNPSCAANACRIVVPITTTQPTGLYPVTFQVSAINGTTTYAASAPVTDTVIVVNRASSPFGAGWWLDGFENLVTLSATKMLWIGGDGSSRLYTRSSDTTVYTVSPAYDRPDTLKRVLGSQTWQRLLGDNAYVEFNSNGQHTTTVNALGWKTTFAYVNGLLNSITLPVPAGSAQVRQYRFWYTSSLLDSVQAPSTSLSRTTRIARSGSKINSITDPDNFATTFSYDAANRIITRTNKLNDPTSFQYDSAGALKQSSLSTARTNGVGSAITTTFRAAETRSAYSSTDLPTLSANVFTQLDGPRTDVGDTTNIIVNKWGAPDSVTNAVGQRTLVSRANTTFPALATKVIAANGLETRAFFNSRGLPDSTVVVDPLNTGSNATTKYTWNPKWNQADSIVRAMGERTRTFFRSSAPIADSMRIGIHGRYVRFTYTPDNQVRSTAEPQLSPDSVVYDSLGNATKAWTPVGRSASVPYFTQLLKDAIGRDTLVISPISGDTTSTVRISYDAADRVIGSVSYGPPRPYSLRLNPSFSPDTAAVQALTRTDSSGYDAEGNLTFKRSVSPTSDVQLNERLTYDAAGRLTRRLIGTGPDSMVYDPAGNVVSAMHRSGKWVTQAFDVLNRLTTRIVPDTTYVKDVNPCVGFATGPLTSSCQMVFPYYPNSGTSLLIPADTSRFVYDSFGNMTQANNRNARIRRSYYRNGGLKTDTMAVGVYANPLADGSTTGQQYSYDLSGRRTQMTWVFTTTSYAYDDMGLLASVTAPGGIPFRYTRTFAGRVDSLILGTGVREKRAYDDDGRLTFRNRVSDYGTMGTLVSDSLSYDKADHLVRGWQQVYQQNPDQTLISYDGLGAVVAREQGSLTGSSNVEEFRNDAFGNVVRKLNRRSAGLINNAPFAMSYSIKGELTSSSALLKSPPESQYQRQDDLGQTFLNGEMIKQGEVVRNPNTGDFDYQLATRNYYGADDRLMVVQKYSWHPGGVADGTWEEYRYDALGRRIMTRARRDTTGSYPAATSGPLCQSTTPICRSFFEAVWWDGDQALVENRTPDGTSDVSNSGSVGNIHGLTIDEPLAVITMTPTPEMRIINYNWRGQGLSSVYTNGAGADLVTGNASADINWPAMTQAETYFTPSLDAPANDNQPKKWMGTFVQNGQGTTGMLYRRNRYFDPNTGRFTQEDPIGIAGGVNAYGFAAGDPVNFGDPFGLCTPMPECVAGLGGLQDAAQQVGNAIKSIPSQIGDFARDPLRGGFAADLAMVPLTIAADVGLVEDAVSSSRILLRTERGLQKGFGVHGADFGLSGNWNASRAADFSRAIHEHINGAGVRVIEGSYRGGSVIHYLNPQTGLSVMSDLSGNYVSAWRLSAEQLKGVLSNGRLF